MSAQLPQEFRERIRGFLQEIAPRELVDELQAQVERELGGRQTTQLAQVLAITHETVTRRIRVTPEAAGSALVDQGGLSPVTAAQIVGVPAERLEATTGADVVEPEPTEQATVVEGWDEFWTPPEGVVDDEAEDADAVATGPAEPGPTEPEEPGPADPEVPSDREPIAVRVPDGVQEPASAPPPRPVGTFDTWSGGSGGRSGPPWGVVIGAAGVLLLIVVIALLSVGGSEDPQPLADATTAPVRTEEQTDAPTEDADEGTEPAAETASPSEAATSTGGSALAIGSVAIGAPDGGPSPLGGPVPVGFTVTGIDGGPSTLRWVLERDGEEVFPPAPLVVPADGDVRLTVPPALLPEPGDYLVRVTSDGTTLLEETFAVAAG